MIIHSASYVVSAGEDANAPILCFENLATAANVAAANQSAYPESNAANPSTAEEWRSNTAVGGHNFTIDIGTAASVGYIALAKHNFGSALVTVRPQGYTGAAWVNLNGGAYIQLPDDKPAIFLFEHQGLEQVRLQLSPTDGIAPRAAVISTGAFLRSPQKTYVGHAPITLNHQITAVSAGSSSGNYLGSVVVGGSTRAQLRLTDLDPGWVRGQLEPFLVHARDQRKPFFFAWRPHTYPRECGYVWLDGDPEVVNSRPNGMMDVTLNVRGVV